MKTLQSALLFNRIYRGLLAVLILLAGLTGQNASASPAAVNGLVGTGTASSCTEAAFNAALVRGGLIFFDCGPAAAVITLTGPKTITLDTAIDGGTLVALAGSAGSGRLFEVLAGVNLSLSNLILSNGNAGVADGGALLNHGTTQISNVTLRGNLAARGGAIFNEGTLSLNGVTVRGNTASDRGGGMYNALPLSPAATPAPSNLVNVTFSANNAPLGGGAIYNDQGTLSINSATLSYNASDAGGASIFNVGTASQGSLKLANTILGPAAPNTTPVNCAGSLLPTSLGGNLSSDATCGLGAVDQSSIDPALDSGGLKNNGGFTETYNLNPSSPAIDKGSATNCPAVDQRGLARPFGAGCDVGALEVQQIFVAPSGPWYVSPSGKDNDLCNSADHPCLTINAAILKAKATDTIYVAQGLYTATSGDEVVKVSKDLTIQGGYSAKFSLQNGMSTIAGRIDSRVHPVQGQRGLTMATGVTLNLSHFVIQGGGSPASTTRQGGGIYVDGKLFGRTLDIASNIADYGGGIYLTSTSQLNLYSSAVHDNTAAYNGGGIYAEGAGLILVTDTLSSNYILPCGSCSFRGIEIDLNNGTLLMAFSTVFSQMGTFGVAAESSIRNNQAHVGLINNILDGPMVCENPGNYFSQSLGWNLANNNTCGLTELTDRVADPNLGFLQNNGGLTPTHALPYYSPAVDMGYPCGSAAVDQRGVAHPKGTSCDAGAYEYNGFSLLAPFDKTFHFPAGMGGADSGGGQGQSNGIIGVLLPSGSAPAGSTFVVTPLDMPAQPLPGGMASAEAFDLRGYIPLAAPVPAASPSAAPLPLAGLTTPMTVSLSYHGIPAGFKPVLMGYDPTLRVWVDLPATVDTTAQTVTALTTRLGSFALAYGVRQVYLPLAIR